MVRPLVITLLTSILACVGCAEEAQFDFASGDGPNPFLSNYEKDTGYVNLKGVEVEVTLEADLTPEYSLQMRRGPVELAQFAVTFLRKRQNLFLEILGEDAMGMRVHRGCFLQIRDKESGPLVDATVRRRGATGGCCRLEEGITGRRCSPEGPA